MIVRCSRLLERLVSVILCLGILTPSAEALQVDARRGVQMFPDERPTKGAPGQNLPNLDEVKRRGPARPKVLPPVPSRRKKFRLEEMDRGKQAGPGNARAEAAPAAPSRLNPLLGALAVAAFNPYDGLSLASTAWTLPEPPASQGTSARGTEGVGWFSGLKGLFGSAAVLPSPQGVFETANCDYVSGWAWDASQPDVPVMVALFNGQQLIGTVLADQYRSDLSMSDGKRHGFRMALPDSLRDASGHELRVKILGAGTGGNTDFELGSSPRNLAACGLPTYGGQITTADCEQVTGRAWDTGRPNTPIDVDIYVRENGADIFRARVSADSFDAQTGVGDNRHGFRLPTPPAARDGQPHTITARPAGKDSSYNLTGATTVTCPAPVYAGHFDSADCDYLTGWAWDSNQPGVPVAVEVLDNGQVVGRALADVLRSDLPMNDGKRHGFQIPVPDVLRDGLTHALSLRVAGETGTLGALTSQACSAQTNSCGAEQDLATTEFVRDLYLGALARQPRPLELQYWNDALRGVAGQGQAALLAKAKLLGRELFLEGEYAGRNRMAATHEAEYVSDLYWSYLQRGPDAGGQNFWVGNIQTQNSQGQNGWVNALTDFENSNEFSNRVASLCPSPTDSFKAYDAVQDFSPLQNADGAWSYGYRLGGGAFTPFTSHFKQFGAGLDTWSQSDGSCCALVARNNTGSALNYDDDAVTQPADLLNLHPGQAGERSVVRWTAPAAGTYLVQGRFQGIDTTRTTTDVSVTHNGANVYTGSVNGFYNDGSPSAAVAPFALTRSVQAGDTLEFSVGVGSNGTYNNDSTGLSVSVGPTPKGPYGGTPAPVPGTVEAELFDLGGEGAGYHDTTPGSQGHDFTLPSPFPPPALRQPTDVEIYKEASGYSNGHYVRLEAGDRMYYTVDVAQSGAYTLEARVRWGSGSGGTFHVEADGVDVTGPIQIPNTGWTPQTITNSSVQLPVGSRVLRIVADTNGAGGAVGDLDYVRLTTVAPPPPTGNSAAFVSQYVPQQMQAGHRYAASLTFRNTGTTTWSPPSYYRIGTQNPQDNATWGLTRVNLPITTPPGSEVTFNFTITAPSTPGNYSFQWRMLREYIEWFGEAAPNVPVTVVNASTPGANAGECVLMSVPQKMEPGQSYPVSVTYRNTGTNTWSPPSYYRLGTQNPQDNATWGLTRVLLPYVTPPGSEVTFNFTVTAPSTPGSYNFQWKMLREYIEWFGDPSTNVPITVGSQGGVGAPPPDATGNGFAVARTDPANQIGGGDDPFSRNHGFSVPLVGLKGRAGLDLGLSLTYNSLIWTRDAATGAVKFDADEGDPSPGFRLGLPVLERRYRDAQGKNAYLLIGASGARTELRQVEYTNVYEALDSSYLQLTDGGWEATLRPADGTQVTFTYSGGKYRCTKILDRNGNYISLAYNSAGDVSQITDTLGRVINLSYDTNARLNALEQNRGGQVHQWATLGYADLSVATGFAAGVNVLGPSNGTVLSVLGRVSLDDGSRYDFVYNSWGQIYRVERHAPDGRLLSYTEYDLQSPTSAQTNNGTDCPRFTQRRDFAKDWNSDAPAVTTYSVDQSGTQVVKNNQTLVGSAGADTPATVLQRISYGAANTFRRGLVTAVETWGQDTPGQFVLKRTAQTTWTQDDESLAYQFNPRVKVSEVSDPQGNHTGTSYEYTSFGLPTEAREWSGTEAGVLRRTHTEYNLDPAYVGRRLLGLVSSTSLYDEQGHVAAKVDYTYDQGGEFLQHQGEPVQHDGTNFGTNFVLGRGLLTSVRRWDVTALHDVTKSVELRMGYNTTGGAVFSRDPLGHQSTIAFADRFADKAGTNTLAYPTLTTDPDGYSSKIEYNFHTGLVARVEDPKGAQRTSTYDAAGRPLRVEVSGKGAAGQVISGGYTRWVYSDASDAVQSWAQVDSGMPEACSISILDGAGRVRAAASDLPNSTGGYSARYASYDIAGRVAGQTNPTEVSGLWNPAGDDAARGWKWTTQTYDWKSRLLVTTLPKLLNPSDSGYAGEAPVTRQVEYGGCGCAGGEVATFTDEAGRRQKVYGDPLGRQLKVETLNPNGSIYSTITNAYNVLDQVTEVRQLVGTNGAAQVTTLGYDGHGRLKSRHLPRYAANTATTYQYSADDTLISMTDPRGVVTTFGFTNAAGYQNKRHLVNSVSYSNAPPNVSVPAPLRFEYDEVGHRISMTDGTGSFGYVYNSLSRLTSETRQFGALQGRTYQISYTYTLSGQLKYLIDPAGSRVDYSYDVAGRMLGAAGSGPASAASYASNMKYRAWGALKDVDLGNQTHQFVGYDSRLRAQTMELRNVIVNPTNQTPLTMKWNYDYYADNRLNHAYDIQNNRFDRKFDYDDQGRLKEAYTGLEARGQAPISPANSPFRQTFGYDVWGNMTERSGRLWKQTLEGESSQYGTDDRRDGWTYDAAGNLLESDSHADTYDAAGNQTRSHALEGGACSPFDYDITQDYDGEGRPAHRVQIKRFDLGGPSCVSQQEEAYYVYSTALGGTKLLELSASGDKVKGYVYGGGTLLAKQEIYPATNGSAVKWQHQNPGSSSWVETGSDRVFERQEMDPLKAEVGTSDPFLITPDPNYTDVHGDAPLFVDGGDPFHLSDGCGDIDGMPASCAEVNERLKNGTAVYDSEEWGRRSDGRGGLENYVVHAAPVFDQIHSSLNVLDSVWVPDYNDASQDHIDPATGALVGVISGRFVSTSSHRVSNSISLKKPTPLTSADFNESVRWNELIKQSLLDAGSALLKDGNCRKALGLTKAGVYSLIQSLLKNADTGMLTSDAVAITIGRGNSAALSFGSSFFSDSMYIYDRGPRNARQWRVWTVLHEIGHVQKSIPDDAGNIAQNTANDKYVFAECNKGIGSVPTVDPPHIPSPR